MPFQIIRNDITKVKADAIVNTANPMQHKDLILDQIEKEPHITQNKLAKTLGVSRSTIQRGMEDLKKKNKLERIGGTRGAALLMQRGFSFKRQCSQGMQGLVKDARFPR